MRSCRCERRFQGWIWCRQLSCQLLVVDLCVHCRVHNIRCPVCLQRTDLTVRIHTTHFLRFLPLSVCVVLHTYIHLRIHAYVYVYMFFIFVCIFVSTYENIHVYMYTYIYIFTLNIYLHTLIYIYIYIFIHI